MTKFNFGSSLKRIYEKLSLTIFHYFTNISSYQYSIFMVSLLFFFHFFILYLIQLFGDFIISKLIPIYIKYEEKNNKIHWAHFLHIFLDEILHAIFAFLLWSALSLGERDSHYYSYHIVNDIKNTKDIKKKSEKRKKMANGRREDDDIESSSITSTNNTISSTSLDNVPQSFELETFGKDSSSLLSKEELIYDEIFVPTCIKREEKKYHIKEHIYVFKSHIKSHYKFLIFASISSCFIDFDHFLYNKSFSVYKATHIHSNKIYLFGHSFINVFLMVFLLYLILPFLNFIFYFLLSNYNYYITKKNYKNIIKYSIIKIKSFFENNIFDLSLSNNDTYERNSLLPSTSNSLHNDYYFSFSNFFTSILNFILLSIKFLFNSFNKFFYNISMVYKNSVNNQTSYYYLPHHLRIKISLCFFISLASNLLRDSTRKGLNFSPFFIIKRKFSLEFVVFVLSLSLTCLLWIYLYPIIDFKNNKSFYCFKRNESRVIL